MTFKKIAPRLPKFLEQHGVSAEDPFSFMIKAGNMGPQGALIPVHSNRITASVTGGTTPLTPGRQSGGKPVWLKKIIIAVAQGGGVTGTLSIAPWDGGTDYSVVIDLNTVQTYDIDFICKGFTLTPSANWAGNGRVWVEGAW